MQLECSSRAAAACSLHAQPATARPVSQAVISGLGPAVRELAAPVPLESEGAREILCETVDRHPTQLAMLALRVSWGEVRIR